MFIKAAVSCVCIVLRLCVCDLSDLIFVEMFQYGFCLVRPNLKQYFYFLQIEWLLVQHCCGTQGQIPVDSRGRHMPQDKKKRLHHFVWFPFYVTRQIKTTNSQLFRIRKTMKSLISKTISTSSYRFIQVSRLELGNVALIHVQILISKTKRNVCSSRIIQLSNLEARGPKFCKPEK